MPWCCIWMKKKLKNSRSAHRLSSSSSSVEAGARVAARHRAGRSLERNCFRKRVVGEIQPRPFPQFTLLNPVPIVRIKYCCHYRRRYHWFYRNRAEVIASVKPGWGEGIVGVKEWLSDTGREGLWKWYECHLSNQITSLLVSNHLTSDFTFTDSRIHCFSKYKVEVIASVKPGSRETILSECMRNSRWTEIESIFIHPISQSRYNLSELFLSHDWGTRRRGRLFTWETFGSYSKRETGI